MQTVLNSPAEYNANWEVGNDDEVPTPFTHFKLGACCSNIYCLSYWTS